MSVPAAYVAVVAIWSVTPLGLVWSNDSMSPVAAACLRMSLAAMVGWVILRLVRIELPWHMKAVKVYGFSVIGVFLGMLLSYIGAKTVPSGIISVMFSTSPIVSGILAHLLIKDRSLNATKILSFFIALVGMCIIFYEREGNSAIGSEGLILVTISVLLFSLSGVLVKGTGSDIHPLAITVGTLVLSVPCYSLSWALLDGSVPTLDWSTKSPWAVVFLAIFGSLIGFAAYYYVLQRMAPASVTTVTLITPIFALAIGSYWNNEILAPQVYIGAAVVLFGLSVFVGSQTIRRLYHRMIPQGFALARKS